MKMAKRILFFIITLLLTNFVKVTTNAVLIDENVSSLFVAPRQTNLLQRYWHLYPNETLPEGDGTEDSPFIISNAREFLIISKAVNSVPNCPFIYCELRNNINFKSYKTPFLPIGFLSSGFLGNFDGHGYTIKNLKINLPEKSYQGLFGKTRQGSIISNLTLKECFINGNFYVGAIVGYANSTTLINCQVNECVINANCLAGALIGAGEEGCQIINSSIDTSMVKGQNRIGLFCGNQENINMVDCVHSSSLVLGEE